MLQRSMDVGEDAAAIMTRVLEWGENSRLITSLQKHKLMAELAKRLRQAGITGIKNSQSTSALDALGFKSHKLSSSNLIGL